MSNFNDNKYQQNTILAGLINGAKRQKTYFHNIDNVLNRAIYIMFKNNKNHFKPNIIKQIIVDGACVNKSDNNNSLSLALNYVKLHIDVYGIEVENIMLEFINILIENGACSNNSQKSTSNTLSLAIATKSLKIINRILQIKPGPEPHNKLLYSRFWNSNYYENECTTLTVAIKTGILDIVKLAYRVGALPDNYQSFSNSLTYAVDTKNFDIIRIMYEFDAVPNNSQTYNNTLSHAIQTKDYNIIKIMHLFNAEPDSTNEMGPYASENTLTIAVDTGDIEIIKMALQFGAKTNNTTSEYNTMTHAVMKGNVDIIKEIIVYGGSSCPCSRVSLFHNNIDLADVNTFTTFYQIYIKNINNYDTDMINSILNLIICSGATISEKINNEILEKKQGNLIDYKIICFYVMLLKYNISIPDHLSENNTMIKEIKKNILILKNELKNTMDELIDLSLKRFITKRNLNEMLLCMPICCINIVYDYHFKEIPLKITNWLNF